MYNVDLDSIHGTRFEYDFKTELFFARALAASWELMQITQGRADAPCTLLIFDLKLDIDWQDQEIGRKFIEFC
mgnify:CR=1 FL=1